MKHLLHHLAEHGSLSREQAIEAFELIMSDPAASAAEGRGAATPAQVGALLAMIAVRGPSIDEMVGAATVMRRKVKPVDVPEDLVVIDTCGVGGTGSSFFNISTTAAIVVASVGRPRNVAVAKHGNRAITSRSGSAQVLEALGVKLQVTGETLTRCLDEIGLCFCYAPCHHPAMKHAGPIRAELGIRTIFNLIGPLTNPAGARRQLIGVPTPEMTATFATVLRELGAEHAMIVHSKLPDGGALGELTNFGVSVAHELHHGMIKSVTIDPAELGVPYAVPTAVTVDGPEASAAMVRKVLAGEPGAARDIVRLNAAAALRIAGLARDLGEGLELATKAIDDGRAQATLEQLVVLTREDKVPA